MNIFKAALLGIVSLIALTIVGGSFYTVDETERVVILRNGALSSVSDPGLQFKLPWVDSTRSISIETHVLDFPDEKIYSKDSQTAVVDFSVNFRALPDQAGAIYSRYKTVDNFSEREIRRQVKEQIKNVFGQYTALTIISDRAKLGADVSAAVEKLGHGLVRIEGLQIENIDFSDQYEASIEATMLAQNSVLKETQNGLKEVQLAAIKVTQAGAVAASNLALATAQASATKLAGDAEAGAIRAKGTALAANPGLVALITAERWKGDLPTTMVPGDAVPFINVK